MPIVETAAALQNVNVKEEAAAGATPMEGVEGNGAPKRRWNRQPVNKKIRRIRRNRRLRKMLIPKNALMSLNELMGSTISEYDIVPEERGFVARVYVNSIQYEGRGEWVCRWEIVHASVTPFDLIPCRSIENCRQK